MCEENKELELNEEESIGLEDMDKDELLNVIYGLLDSKENQIELDKESIASSKIFDDGVAKALYYSGFYNCLISSGFSVDNAYELTLNQNTCDNNQSLQKIVNEGSVDIARIQEVKVEQQQI